METINVIVVKKGTVESIKSFGIPDSTQITEIANKAEAFFKEKCIEFGFNNDDKEFFNDSIDDAIDDCIEDGYYEGANFSINLVWSTI